MYIQAASRFTTVEAIKQALNNLNEHIALGPDMLPTCIFKQCAYVLARVLHKLTLAILAIAKCTARSIIECVVPFFKHKFIYRAANDKGHTAHFAN